MSRMGKYDYSMYTTDDFGDREHMEYWGLHEVDGRIEVDVDRYVWASEKVGITDFIPSLFRDRSGYYFPSRKSRYDYTTNYLLDCIQELSENWNQEYKPLFKRIKSPKEAGESYRTSTMMMFGNSDTFDSIELGARWAMFERMKVYSRIIDELYCVFIMKMCTEIDRMLLRALSMEYYESDEFSIQQFIAYCNARSNSSVKDLKGWDEFSKFHNINNFLKHNSRKSYEILKKYHPECVHESDKVQYENGMFSFNWINLEKVDIDSFLSSMREFMVEFGEKIMYEGQERASWDYDEYFIDASKEMLDPMEYWGIYEACGMSPWD